MVSAPPAGTRFSGGKKKVGGVLVPKRIRFSGGTMPPPPNCVTSVSECVSPPRFSKRSEEPAFRLTCVGAKCHEPANLWSTSWPMKLSNVVLPLPTHVGGLAGTAALNDAASQSSWAMTRPGFADATAARVRNAAATATSTETRTALIDLPSGLPATSGIAEHYVRSGPAGFQVLRAYA